MLIYISTTQPDKEKFFSKLTATLLAFFILFSPLASALAEDKTTSAGTGSATEGTTVTKHIFANGNEIGTVTGTGADAVPRYVHTDQLTGSNVITNAAGTKDETLNYFPFGGVRIDSGTYSDQRKFIGQEYDEDTGLNYFNARYYDSAIGRFVNQDSMFWQLPKELLFDPEQQNSYSYARNNPINLSDPSGLLTIIVPGTGYTPKDWSSTGAAAEFIFSVGKTFKETTQILEWSGKNSEEARAVAANSLIEMVKDHNFADGEQLNIIGHSHGGNIAIIASQNPEMKKIDTLVTLGTPNRTTYQPEKIGLHLNLYSRFDFVQTAGEIGDPFNVSGTDSRQFKGADNIGVGLRAGILPLQSHTNLWKNPSVWSLVDKKINSAKSSW